MGSTFELKSTTYFKLKILASLRSDLRTGGFFESDAIHIAFQRRETGQENTLEDVCLLFHMEQVIS